ncbi:hypothetical protein K1T71_011063, partial [Dendrolimus kikuchii]
TDGFLMIFFTIGPIIDGCYPDMNVKFGTLTSVERSRQVQSKVLALLLVHKILKLKLGIMQTKILKN